MAKVSDELIVTNGLTLEGIANVTTSSYTVAVDSDGYPQVAVIRVYNAATITLPAVKDGAQLQIISNYSDISPSNAVLIVPDDPTTETVLSSDSYALTWPRESIVLLGDTNATPDDWGAI
jgi:hypothetical protein